MNETLYEPRRQSLRMTKALEIIASPGKRKFEVENETEVEEGTRNYGLEKRLKFGS